MLILLAYLDWCYLSGCFVLSRKTGLGFSLTRHCLFKESPPLVDVYVTHEDPEAASADSRWERRVMRWCLWTRTPPPPPSIPCVLSVASSTGREKTTCTITRTKWTMTWCATFAFSLCCSRWIPPVDTRSAASASGTSCRRRISVHWTGRDFTLSCVRSLAF